MKWMRVSHNVQNCNTSTNNNVIHNVNFILLVFGSFGTPLHRFVSPRRVFAYLSLLLNYLKWNIRLMQNLNFNNRVASGNIWASHVDTFIWIVICLLHFCVIYLHSHWVKQNIIQIRQRHIAFDLINNIKLQHLVRRAASGGAVCTSSRHCSGSQHITLAVNSDVSSFSAEIWFCLHYT